MCSQKLGVVVSKATHNTVASGRCVANVNTCDITLVGLITVLYMLRLFLISEQHAAKRMCAVTANSHVRDWTEPVLTASCVAPVHLYRAVRSFVSVMCRSAAFLKIRPVAGKRRNAPTLFGRLKDNEQRFFLFENLKIWRFEITAAPGDCKKDNTMRLHAVCRVTSLCIFETNGNIAFSCCVIFKLPSRN